MKKLTTEEFVQKAKQRHGEKYDYSLVVYEKGKIPVRIICDLHGEFVQGPNDHLSGKGCSKCGSTKSISDRTKNVSSFVQEARSIHGNLYDYSKVEYKTNKTLVVISCPVHGDFYQRPLNHIKDKQGCPKCGKNKAVKQLVKPLEQFVAEATAVHSGRYSYEHVVYKTTHTPVLITCPIQGVFLQAPDSHLHGRGCSACAKSGFDMSKPGLLYYLKVTADDGTTLYKIGITNLTVAQRFLATDLAKIKVIALVEYVIGRDAYNEEQKILAQYKEYKYQGPKVLSSGNTELFIKDILEKDNG